MIASKYTVHFHRSRRGGPSARLGRRQQRAAGPSLVRPPCSQPPPTGLAGAARQRLPRQSRTLAAAQQPLTGLRCMEEAYDALAARALLLHAAAQEQRAQQPAGAAPRGGRLVIGIAGAPGSGKSTLAAAVAARINARAAGAAAAAQQVPMDGFHLYRAQLDAFPDPAAAHARRGAPWTFDADAYLACLRRLKAGADEAAPSFSHGTGDPVAGDVPVLATHSIVLTEGNWLLLGEARLRKWPAGRSTNPGLPPRRSGLPRRFWLPP